MKRKIFLLGLIAVSFLATAQVTVQKGSAVYLQENALISIEGDIEIAENMDGDGAFFLVGETKQTIGLFGHSLPSLYIQNTAGVLLSSPLQIRKRLVLQSGHLILGVHNLELGTEAEAAGNKSAYILSDGGGKVLKSVQKNLDRFFLPLGTETGYSPLQLKSTGKYNKACLEVGTSPEVNPNKPASTTDYLNSYWTISRKGITGNVMATGFYTQVTGVEANMQAYFWNGNEWLSKQSPVDTRNKLLSVDVPEGSGEMYAMRKGNKLTDVVVAMTVLPNPVHNTATLLIRNAKDERASVSIINSTGAVVMTQPIVLGKGLNPIQLDVQTLPKGHYVITSTLQKSKPVTMIKQ